MHFPPIIILTLCLVYGSCRKEEVNRFPLAEEHNIDGVALSAAFDEMKKVEGALSLIVERHETIVAEEFYLYNNYGPDSIKNIMSVTKSITGILTGIAIDKGFIEDINDPLDKYLGSIITIDDATKAKITIGQLLKMSAGHSWNGTSPSSLFADWINSADQVKYIIDLPVVSTPGTTFNYSDGASHLLSVIISEATGQDLLDFARINLFDPMEIVKYQWSEDRQGYPVGAAGLRITPHDMVKFGRLILDGGKYQGTRIVPESWIKEMTSLKISTNNDVLYGPGYGYQIWTGNENGMRYFMAMGWGGQFIFILPEKDAVITASCWTSGYDWQQAGEHWTKIIRIIVEQIFPAIG